MLLENCEFQIILTQRFIDESWVSRRAGWSLVDGRGTRQAERRCCAQFAQGIYFAVWEGVSMNLSEALDVERINTSLRGDAKVHVLEELLDLAVKSGKIRDREQVLKEILSREAIRSTGIGNGVAVPHVESDAVDGVVVALGISQKGVDFDAPDERPVRVYALIVAQKGEDADYMSLLGRVARLFRNPAFRWQVEEATSPDEVLELIQERESGHALGL
jgi:mannitol/fructose-specific phosphotransferase system IIA component (Ntr-type)